MSNIKGLNSNHQALLLSLVFSVGIGINQHQNKTSRNKTSQIPGVVQYVSAARLIQQEIKSKCG